MNYGYAMALLFAIPIYLPCILRSFWVDEAGTYWIAYQGFWSAVEKCIHYPGQSILYGALASLFCLDGGPWMEPLLRLPSVVGFGAALYFTARLAERALGTGAGVCAFVLLLYHPVSIDVLIQARPYGLAAGAVAASCCLLWEWVQNRDPRTAAAYVVATALIFYLHYLYAVVLLAQGIYLIWVFAVERRTSGWKQVLAAAAALAVLLVPLTAHLAVTAREARTMPALRNPDFPELLSGIIPLATGIGIVAATVLLQAGRVWGVLRPRWNLMGGSVWALIAVWTIGGPLVLFAIAHGLDLVVAEKRYLGHATPAFALALAGAAVTAFPPRVAIRWAFLVALLSTGSPMEWRPAWNIGSFEVRPAVEAVRDIRPSEPPPLLMQSTLIESNSLDWRKGPQGSRLFHELVAYPVPNPVFGLPHTIGTAEMLHVDGLLDGPLRNVPVILFLRLGEMPLWLTERMAARGYRLERVRPNYYTVGIFRRNPVP